MDQHCIAYGIEGEQGPRTPLPFTLREREEVNSIIHSACHLGDTLRKGPSNDNYFTKAAMHQPNNENMK